MCAYECVVHAHTGAQVCACLCTCARVQVCMPCVHTCKRVCICECSVCVPCECACVQGHAPCVDGYTCARVCMHRAHTHVCECTVYCALCVCVCMFALHARVPLHVPRVCARAPCACVCVCARRRMWAWWRWVACPGPFPFVAAPSCGHGEDRTTARRPAWLTFTAVRWSWSHVMSGLGERPTQLQSDVETSWEMLDLGL